ncbi:hypothetical protein bcgnr5372_38250 [Bacillus luti]|nr:hypothetical protein [Bacillus cereus]HDR8327210.1 hypothetical protein [Bacillus cereus]HDR8336400.1 hypothetical protein [Bacillus cereus]
MKNNIEITIATGNAAFEDDKTIEFARIIKKLAQSIEYGSVPARLMDLNGNKVGEVVEDGEKEIERFDSDSIYIEISTSNAAFEEAGAEYEVSRILKKLAEDSVHGSIPSSLRDINGHKVGTVTEN